MPDDVAQTTPRTLIDSSAAAEMLGICRRSLWNLVAAGKLPVYKVSTRVRRFDVAEISAYLEGVRSTEC